MLPYIYRLGFGKGGTEYQILGELFSDMENALVALTLWKRVLSYIEHILRILEETLWVTPQYLMAIISDNDKELHNPCNG